LELALDDIEGPTIGVLSPYLAGYFYGSLISAVHRVVSANAGRLIAVSTAALGADFLRGATGGDQLPRVAWDRVAGFVTVAKAAPLDYLEALRRAGKPVVALSHQEPGFACPAVLADNRGGVAKAVEHLLGHGHERIAFAGCLDQFDVQERYAAYRGTLAAHGIEPDPSLFFAAPDNLEPGGRYAAESMLAAGLPCTAVVAGDDLNAMGIMAVLKQAGCRLPRDQAVIGFDNVAGTNLLSPSLTTVSQRFEAMGDLAGRLLLRLIDGQDVEVGPHVLDALLVPRESCGCSPNFGLLARGGPERYGDPVARFAEVLHEVLVSNGTMLPGLAEEKVMQLARVVEGIFQHVADRDLTPLELLDLGQACHDLYDLAPTPATSDAVLGLARQLCSKLAEPGGAAGGARLATLLRLNQCAAEVHLSLSKAALGERNAAYYDLREAIRNEHQISMDLLCNHETGPQPLSWLARTNATAGALGLWQGLGRRELQDDGDHGGPTRPSPAGTDDAARGPHPPLPEPGGEGSRLEVTSTFAVGTGAAGTGQLALSSFTYPAEGFPPSELFERAGRDDLVLVFPVRNEHTYWGLLSVVMPVNSSLFNQDTLFEWEALLSAALDYQEVVRALREQSEALRERGKQLALSYERERQMALAVKESEERYALAFSAANDVLWDWDLLAGTVYFSTRWQERLGFGPGSAGTKAEDWLDLVHPDDRPALRSAMDELRQGEKSTLRYEGRVMAADGDYRWVVCRSVALPGQGAPAKRIVGSIADITERRSLEQRLRHQALHDDLTGLPNRALFLDRLSQAIASTKRRRRYSYAVLWLDLDGFKVLNDSLGHFAGDKLLVQVAGRVREHVRETDTAARFGGDEFALLLEDAGSLSSLDGVAHRLLEHLNEPYDLDGHRVVVTASLGIATSAAGYQQPEEVLRDADIAMYRAKANGPGTFAKFDSSMYAGALTRMRTETELRQAIELGQLELHYQPIVSLAAEGLLSMESLVRWRHPSAGLVAPLRFLQVAEESGLVVPMGRWVQEEACRQLAEWRSGALVGPQVRVGVNVSNREFWNPHFSSHIDRVLASSGVPPGCFVVEITEGVIMDNLEHALDGLLELHSKGVQISIDDFGTGYSSLQALHRLPIDALKIDQSFIASLGSNDRVTELVRTIVQMGNNLGLRVIAEGIETVAQQEILAKLGCPWGQGYLFSRPLPANELSSLLASERFGGNGARALLLPKG
jgi:diguanylate cyclase (GGDEF)-like protein/PAS domain S-box-containing protein